MVKKIDHDHDTIDFVHGQWSKSTNFDHLTMVILKFWPWSWSKIFDHLTMTPGRRSNGQKIVVILPPPLIQKVKNVNDKLSNTRHSYIELIIILNINNNFNNNFKINNNFKSINEIVIYFFP